MKKKLRLEELSIDSFVTATSAAARGTVQAHDATWHCTTECTHQEPTCDFECGASFPYQKACEASEFCGGSRAPC